MRSTPRSESVAEGMCCSHGGWMAELMMNHTTTRITHVFGASTPNKSKCIKLVPPVRRTNKDERIANRMVMSCFSQGGGEVRARFQHQSSSLPARSTSIARPPSSPAYEAGLLPPVGFLTLQNNLSRYVRQATLSPESNLETISILLP